MLTTKHPACRRRCRGGCGCGAGVGAHRRRHGAAAGARGPSQQTAACCAFCAAPPRAAAADRPLPRSSPSRPLPAQGGAPRPRSGAPRAPPPPPAPCAAAPRLRAPALQAPNAGAAGGGRSATRSNKRRQLICERLGRRIRTHYKTRGIALRSRGARAARAPLPSASFAADHLMVCGIRPVGGEAANWPHDPISPSVHVLSNLLAHRQTDRRIRGPWLGTRLLRWDAAGWLDWGCERDLPGISSRPRGNAAGGDAARETCGVEPERNC